MNKNNIIEAKNLYFAYGKDEVLHNVNLQISSKDFLAIIGPNGGGKSTLLKLLLGILRPSRGKIKIFGKAPEDMFLKLGYVPQDTNINKNFPIRVLDVVLQGRLGISKKFWGYSKEDFIIAKESLEKVGAYIFKDKKIGDLSGGERQRVFIARALATQADILLLDEPTSSIDSKGQINLYATLKELNKHKGIIVVSHNINVVMSFASKVAYINKTLFMHNSPALNKDRILQSIGSSSEHICPVELMINENMCLHTHNKDKK